jgi:hypothetical protein
VLAKKMELKKDTVFKEAADLSQTMWWELLDIIVVSVLRIISTNSNYLVIFLTLRKSKLTPFEGL